MDLRDSQETKETSHQKSWRRLLGGVSRLSNTARQAHPQAPAAYDKLHRHISFSREDYLSLSCLPSPSYPSAKLQNQDILIHSACIDLCMIRLRQRHLYTGVREALGANAPQHPRRVHTPERRAHSLGAPERSHVGMPACMHALQSTHACADVCTCTYRRHLYVFICTCEILR